MRKTNEDVLCLHINSDDHKRVRKIDWIFRILELIHFLMFTMFKPLAKA